MIPESFAFAAAESTGVITDEKGLTDGLEMGERQEVENRGQMTTR